jgi:hypothetical protein
MRSSSPFLSPALAAAVIGGTLIPGAMIGGFTLVILLA